GTGGGAPTDDASGRVVCAAGALGRGVAPLALAPGAASPRCGGCAALPAGGAGPPAPGAAAPPRKRRGGARGRRGGAGGGEGGHQAAAVVDHFENVVVARGLLKVRAREIGGAHHRTLRAVAAPEAAVTARAVLLPRDDHDFVQAVRGELGRGAGVGTALDLV